MATRLAFMVEQDGTVLLNEYARRAHVRMLADAFYLARWRKRGHEVAAAETCARYGHDVRAGMCDRCLRGVEDMRLEPQANPAGEVRSGRAPAPWR